MRILLLHGIPEDEELRRAWNRLAQEVESPQVFYTFEWAIAVQRAYAGTVCSLLFLGYDGDSLAGVAAFGQRNEGIGETFFLTANTADYCDFLSAPGKRQEFVHGVLAELRNRKIPKLVLTNLASDSASVAAIRGSAHSFQYHLHARRAYLCARVVLGSDEQRAELKRSLTEKKRLRRNLRALGKLGQISVRHDSDWVQIEPALSKFNSTHVARFLSTGRLSNLIQAERRAFLHELAREISRCGGMSMSQFVIDQNPVAWNYGFRFAGSWFWYQPTVDTCHRYAAFSPGYCLLAEIVESACDDPEIDVVDLGLGAEDYKDQFATSSRETLYCVLNRDFSAHLWAALRDRVAAVVRAVPAVERSMRFVLSLATKATKRMPNQSLWASVKWLFRSAWNRALAFDQVHLFEWIPQPADRASSVNLVPLSSELMGAAAIHYADDPNTMKFLMRSARRFRTETRRGFALLSAEGMPLHFCWVADFDGFEMDELDRRLESADKDAVMIFDCFTPPAARGRGYFAQTIAVLADQLRAEGKLPWIFGAAANESSLRGIRKSSFRYRYCLGRKRFLWVSWVKDSVPSAPLQNVVSSAPAQ
ncbi:MAG TPA: GNAT family N-acetyltransferase [Candidatus Sulfotelmatobacter sp.]|nr:GNAT family N-acetyltransferase [Candidatus Sulfotelmatobacter sp.]